MSKSSKVAEPINNGMSQAEILQALPQFAYTPASNISKNQMLHEIVDSQFTIPHDHRISGPPFPDMHLNEYIPLWMPDDEATFGRDYGEDYPKMLKLTKEVIASLDKIQRGSVLGKQSATAPVAQAKVSEQSESAVQQEDQSSSAPSTPKKQTKSSVKSKAKKAKEEAEKSDVMEFNSNIIADVPSVATSESNSETSDTEVPMATVEQPKSTRVSQKMVDADFDALAEKFLQVTSLGEKKPVFLPKNVRDTLEILARLSGDSRVSPSHIAINIIQTFIDEHRDLINRKLGSVKLSI